MTPGQTKFLIASGALVTAGLFWFAPRESVVAVSEPAKTTTAQAPKRAAEQPALSAAAQSLDKPLKSAQAREHLTKKATGELFAKSSWVIAPPPPPPPPAPPPPPPPPPPSAPALPYTYMGKLEQGETHVVILNKGNRVVTVSLGDVLENTYKVESIEASKVTFTYLPLGISQSLSTGSAL